MQKRLMILGAGPNQLPGIKKAVNLGHKVITVDNIPDSIGHKYSQQYVNCSTVDKECVLKAAVELEIDGIVTFASDVAIPTLRYVVEQYAEGIDVSGDGFLSDGRFTFAVITKKYKQDFIVTGHRIPTAISVDDQNRIIAEVAKTCAAIGYMDGPLDFDARISNDHVIVLELSPG